MSYVICIGSIVKGVGMPRNKGADEPNVNEARENIQKRKEMAKKNAIEEAKTPSDNTPKGNTPPASPNAKLPTPQPTPRYTIP